MKWFQRQRRFTLVVRGENGNELHRAIWWTGGDAVAVVTVTNPDAVWYSVGDDVPGVTA